MNDSKMSTSKTTTVYNQSLRRINSAVSLKREDILNNFSEELISKSWEVFSRLILKNYESGKGTNVPRFGSFTFSNAELNMEGTTNTSTRDTKQRTPIFLVSKEFVDKIKPGIWTDSNGIIYYNQKESNSISHVRLNYAELAYSLNITKEDYTTILNNLIGFVGDSIINGQFRNKEMPLLGRLEIRNNILAVVFKEELSKRIGLIPNKLISIKKHVNLFMEANRNQAESSKIEERLVTQARTSGDLSKSLQKLRPRTAVLTKITADGEKWLKDNFDIDINNLEDIKLDDKGNNEGNIIPDLNDGNKSKAKKEPYSLINDINKITAIQPKRLEDLKINIDILVAIHFHQAFIRNEMKSLDKSNSGLLKKYSALNAFTKANVHNNLNSKTIIDLFNIYSSEKSDTIDYKKVLNKLFLDINTYLNFENNLKETLEKSNKEDFYYSHRPKSSQPVSSRALNNTKLSTTNYKTEENKKIELEEVSKEIKTIKIIFNKLKSKFANLYEQKISLSEFMNILREFSIVFPKDKILKIISFIEIPEVESFSIKDFEIYLEKCKILSSEMTSDELKSALGKLKDVIYKLGGANFLFKSNKNTDELEKSITKNTFVNFLKNKANFSEEILESIYFNLTKSNRNFTIEDFEKTFSSSLEKNSTSSQINKDFEISSIQIINEKLFQNHFKHDDYFDNFLNYKTNRSDGVLSRTDFHSAIKKENFRFTEEEIEYLFSIFDKNKDNLIDRQEFILTLKKVSQALFKFKDMIKKNNLDIQDLMCRMQLSMEKDTNKKFDFFSFKEKIKKLDHTLSNEFVKYLFDEMKIGEYVDYTTLERELNVFKKEHFINTNNEAFTQNFTNNLRKASNYQEISKLCASIDNLNMGLLPKIDFCKIIRKMTDEYKDEDIMKFLRLSSLIEEGKVMYPEFLDLIFYDHTGDKFNFIVELMKSLYINECSRDIDKLFSKISGEVLKKPIGNVYLEDKNKIISLAQFVNFLKKIPELSDIELNKHILCKFDLDSDGKISKDDMKGILDRYATTSFFKRENAENKPGVNLFSSEVEEISKEKFQKIVRDIKNAMKKKNWTDIGLFNKLDTNNDGFVSHPEFNNNIDGIIKLSPSLKDQFFNYLDIRSLGLVDKETFLKRFKEYETSEIIVKNSWDTENLILLQITKWIRNNWKLTCEEIFRIFDSDSDGLINLDDLKKFLLERLNLLKIDFDDFKLARVLTKISLTKNNNICLSDLKEFIEKCKAEKNSNFNKKPTDTFFDENLEAERKKDWIAQAIQRFGFYVTENYESVETFFKENTELSTKDKFRFEDFKNFLENHPRCFASYKFTSDEVIIIYTNFDSHKKSYLNLDDLNNKLSNSNFLKRMHIDIKNSIRNNFIDGIEAFNYFKNKLHNNDTVNLSLTKKEIFEGIQSLFPNKYQTNIIIEYLKNNFKDPDMIKFSEFNYSYFDTVQSEKVLTNNLLTSVDRIKLNKLSRADQINRPNTSRPGAIPKTLPRSQSASITNFTPRATSTKNNAASHSIKFNLATPFDDDPLEKIKRIIKTSRFDYSSYFKMHEVMLENGMSNQFEFKNMIKKLNLGLTTLEIDTIYAKVIKGSDGKVNLKEFLKFIHSEDQNLAVVRKNSEAFISEIKQFMYKYYTNIKLAFQFNNDTTSNNMDLIKFKNVINDLFQKETRPLPNFAMIKSAFDYVDIKKDGVIDMNEWLRAFASIGSSLDIKNPGNPVILKQIRDWENSNEVSLIYQSITRNKKIIRDKVKQMIIAQKSKNVIHSENLIAVLKEILRNFNLTSIQMKIIMAVGVIDRSSMIDFDLFMNVVESSSKKAASHPKLN